MYNVSIFEGLNRNGLIVAPLNILAVAFPGPSIKDLDCFVGLDDRCNRLSLIDSSETSKTLSI
jgi:hypothetical protein